MDVFVCSVACSCQRAASFAATVLPRRSGRLSASLRPLANRQVRLGSQSCRIRLAPAQSAPLRPRKKPRMAPLAVFSAGRVFTRLSVGARSRSRSSVRLEAPSSASVRGAFLRCGMPRLEKLASRREYDVSSPFASLNSTLAPPPASNSPSFSADAGNGGRGSSKPQARTEVRSGTRRRASS